MSTYDLAKAILPHLINTDYSTNPHSMARRAFEYAKALEEVAPEFEEKPIPITNFGMSDEFPPWDSSITLSQADDYIISLGNEDWLSSNVNINFRIDGC